MAVELKQGVYWVGVVDWSIRHFHGYELSVHRGTTYNAYLIVDEKIALVDSVGGPYGKELIENIRAIVDPAKIDVVVTNHAEPDHSGALPLVMQHCPNAALVVSRKGAESVPGHYHQPWKFTVVKTGDRLSLGKHELVFIEASMLHWPDSMFTYVTGHNILMPNDAFGQHYATAFRFNDQVDECELYQEALKYYANIITPYSHLVTRKIDELLAMNVPIDIIAPSHGVIWRQDPIQIVNKYREWAAQAPEKRAVILYDTMWQATHQMALAISDGLVAEGIPTKLLQMSVSDRNDALVDVFLSKAIVVGSPTLNNALIPTITPILEDLRALKFRNKIGAAFGSYGWTGESVKLIEEHFQKAKIPIAAEGLQVKWQPSADDLAKCGQLGRRLAAAIKA